MTRAFKCKECGNIVDFDSYPPGLREIYLTLEHAKLCEVCGRDLKIVKEEPMATKLMKDEECSHDSIPRTKICEICGKEYDSSDPPFSNMWCPKCSYQAMEDLKP